MFELLATVDPMAALMGGLWLFAAGMFPVGIMLGSSCSPCCGQPPCDTCTSGELPDTVTVTFDGFTDKTKGPDLITIGFSSCFGGGASARVTAPGGDPTTDKGPISAISLTSGGSGYAKLGRVAPTVTASGGSGSGVTLTPTLTQAQDSCKVDYWKVTAVSVSGGSGYADGDQVTFTVAEGDTEAQAASATIHTTRNEPTLTALASGGTGATFSIAYTKNAGPPETWSISSISVTNGGTGYSGGSSLNISLGTDDVEVYGAYAYITTSRTQPTVSAGVSGTGSGASLTVSLSSGYGDEYGPTWTVSSIGITNGGSGYSEWDQVTVNVTDGQQSYYSWFDAYVTGVDENGAITAITIYYGGDYYKDAGVITGVSLYGGGEYYKDDGIPTCVSVENGGVYYREDASVAPYVAEVTVTVADQRLPSNGSGATFTATVEDNTSSPDFGKIKSLAVDGGGNGYLAWKWVASACCGWQLNGKSIVLHRGHLPYGSIYAGEDLYVSKDCVYSHEMCGGWAAGSNGVMSIRCFYKGQNKPPHVLITRWGASTETTGDNACAVRLNASAPITNCSGMSFTGSSVYYPGITVAVSAGGEYDPTYKNPAGTFPNLTQWGSCTPCCQGDEAIPSEIEVEVEDRGYYGGESMSGTYVLHASGYLGLSWNGGRGCLDDWCTQRFIISVGINPGMCQDTEGCDNCIKKCEISASCRREFRPAVWWNPDDDDMRRCYLNDPDLDDAGRLEAYCTNFCHDTPLCRPPSGMEFSFYKPNGSENFSDIGCPHCCDENVKPTWHEGDPREGPYTGPPIPDHRNTFKLTIA